MNERRFPRLAPGSPISAGEMNRALAAVEALSRTGGPRVLAAGDGLALKPPAERPWFWAKLTARDDSGPQPAYSWTRLTHRHSQAGDYTYAGVQRVEDLSFSGSPLYLPAYEALGAEVDTPTVVKLRRGVGDFYIFRCGCQGEGSGRGSGSGDEESGSGSGSGSGGLNPDDFTSRVSSCAAVASWFSFPRPRFKITAVFHGAKCGFPASITEWLEPTSPGGEWLYLSPPNIPPLYVCDGCLGGTNGPNVRLTIWCCSVPLDPEDEESPTTDYLCVHVQIEGSEGINSMMCNNDQLPPECDCRNIEPLCYHSDLKINAEPFLAYDHIGITEPLIDPCVQFYNSVEFLITGPYF